MYIKCFNNLQNLWINIEYIYTVKITIKAKTLENEKLLHIIFSAFPFGPVHERKIPQNPNWVLSKHQPETGCRYVDIKKCQE